MLGHRISHILAGIAVLAVGVPLVAQAMPIDGSGATVSEVAQRLVTPVEDLVSVYDSGELDASTEAKAIAAAARTGSQFVVSGSASLAMQRIRRGSTNVQVAPSGMSIPMGTTVLDADAVGALMGLRTSAALSATSIVMSAKTAGLRGARAGDIVTLRSRYGANVDFTIGDVIPDEITGGTELLMSPAAASRLALERKSSVIIWGFGSRTAIDQALANEGAVTTRIRIRRSWDAFDPDSTLGMASTKELLGEFAYSVGASGTVSIDAGWRAANLPSGRRVLNSRIPINARCHNAVEPALRAALAEIAAAGVGGVFDVVNANTYGGCYNPRFSRLSPDSTIGFLSRHTWAMALDTNTVGSCQGCAPPDFATNPGGCTAVRIMRKHGFAWGGNFLTADGMHFEYVGERRDTYAYPSRYCANLPGNTLALEAETTQRATIFADAGMIADEHHGEP